MLEGYPERNVSGFMGFRKEKAAYSYTSVMEIKNINMGNEASGAGDIIRRRGEEHEKIAEYIQSQLKKVNCMTN